MLMDMELFKEERQADLEKKIEKTRNSLSTDKLDMSFGEIMNMYEREEIIIEPEFQRLYRWSDYQKTRFIESILLGIPIPPIFVAEDKKGRWELVDGLQRLSTVLSFFGLLRSNSEETRNLNNWILGPGDIVDELYNFNCQTLPLKFQLNIKRAACRIEIIKWNSDYDMRFELFNRLNTGGTPLTDQEIRNCIFRGISTNFNAFLKEEAKKDKFLELIALTDRQLSELFNEELVLRFASLYQNWSNVKENISQHMTKFMKDAVQNDSFNYDRIKKVFNRTVNVLMPLGKDIFRVGNYVFSTSLYDAIMIGVSENIEKYESLSNEEVMDKILLLKKSTEFRNLMGSAAYSKQRIIKRLQTSKKIFDS
jgi:hypothetical protein